MTRQEYLEEIYMNVETLNRCSRNSGSFEEAQRQLAYLQYRLLQSLVEDMEKDNG